MNALSRRKFLRLSAAAAALAGLPRLGRAATGTPLRTEVVVVGAGIAGLAAARTLAQSHWDVVLLEARERIGGRIWTRQDLGFPMDLGASWIHGISGNPISKLANTLGMETVRTHYGAIQVYRDDGAPLSKQEHNALLTRYQSVLTQTYQMRAASSVERSLGSAVAAVIAQQHFSAAEIRDLHYAFNSEIEHDYGGAIADLSLKYWDQDGEFDGPDVLLPGGYRQIVDYLADGLTIQQGAVVTHIAYGDHGVQLLTAAGQEIQASYAIVTVPLGVLKRAAIQFQPALPIGKQQAIAKLGMGLLNKTWLKFSAPFWDSKPELLGYIDAGKGRWAEWLNFHHYSGQPVLLGFNAAAYAQTMESWEDNAIIDDALRVLRTLYGSAVTEPEGYAVTRWRQDEFAGGSYSYLAAGAVPQHFDDLARPVAGRLFFAGEATHRRYPQTVHGAYLSGIRAAGQVNDLG